MAQGHFIEGQFENDQFKLNLGLSLYVWSEGGIYYVYSPALDITGYGETEREAKDSFTITLGEFLDYTHNKKTIFDELEKLGWTTNRRKKKVKAPELEEILESNDELRHIINKRGIKRENTNIDLALA